MPGGGHAVEGYVDVALDGVPDFYRCADCADIRKLLLVLVDLAHVVCAAPARPFGVFVPGSSPRRTPR